MVGVDDQREWRAGRRRDRRTGRGCARNQALGDTQRSL